MLATLAVFALIMLLLVWGVSAMQWTVLTTNNNVRDALATSSRPLETATYSIPQGSQQSYAISIIGFRTIGSGYGCGVSGSFPTCTLPAPGSDLATTIDDYAIFSFTNPNGTALTVWYTGPQGNLTQDCSGGPAIVTCIYQPAADRSRIGPYTTFFKTPITGNYTIHLLSIQCTWTPNNCSTSTAIGTLTMATGSLTYNRPYWALGLATVIVVGASIAGTVAYLATSRYREHRQRAAPRPRS